MTDKERLKEIEVKYSILTVSSEKNGMEYTEVDVEDLVFLIQNSFKQAERVEELEEREKIYKEIIQSYGKIADGFVDDIESLVKRNEHYKQALEEIARGRFPGASYKARQALKGETK